MTMSSGLNKKAIIVGSLGQDGKLLIDLLSGKDYLIIEINKLNFNINNFKSVEELVKKYLPQEIYFLAAYHNSSEDIVSSEYQVLNKSFEVNTFGLINFLESIRLYSHNTKLFYASSSMIFDSNINQIINENSKIKTNCAYSISKFASGQICKMYREKYKIFVTVGILFNHESEFRKDKFVTKKISKTIVEILNGKAKQLEIGNIDSIVDWGYAKDFVNAIYLVLQLNEPDDFIIATGEKHSLKEYLFHSFQHVGLNYLDYVKVNPDFLTRQSTVRIGDPTKLKKLTNWQPTLKFNEMVCRLIDIELSKNN